MSMATAETDRPAPAQRRNGAGTAALVIGVNALVLAVLIIFVPIAAILGIIAVIFDLGMYERIEEMPTTRTRPHRSRPGPIAPAFV